jgi:two-component system sensor histidine kinase UhpB
MKQPGPIRQRSSRDVSVVSPLRVFALVLAIVFAVEYAIMALLATILPLSSGGALLSLLDSLALVAAFCPALWLIVIRPLRSLVAERGELLARTLTIQEEERTRLSRDLHDELGQAQTAVLLGLRSVADARSLDEARERARSVHDIAVGAVEATRRMARGLSPSVLIDFGLTQAIDRVCEDVAAAADIEVNRSIQIGAQRFHPSIEIAAYRVAQEALTNALKHAGATSINLTLRIQSDRLVLEVTDNGRGIRHTEPAGPGLGLAGMRQRVLLLGGEFRLSSGHAPGTTLRAAFPAGSSNP